MSFLLSKISFKKAGEYEIGKDHAIFDESIGHIILKHSI